MGDRRDSPARQSRPLTRRHSHSTGEWVACHGARPPLQLSPLQLTLPGRTYPGRKKRKTTRNSHCLVHASIGAPPLRMCSQPLPPSHPEPSTSSQSPVPASRVELSIMLPPSGAASIHAHAAVSASAPAAQPTPPPPLNPTFPSAEAIWPLAAAFGMLQENTSAAPLPRPLSGLDSAGPL